MSSKTKANASKEEARPQLKPKLRFPEFWEAGDWKERTMGSIGSFASGGTPSKDNPDYWNGSIPWVSASSMYDLVVDKADHYVTPLAIGKGTRIAKKGSILILVRGSMLFNRVPICIAGIDVAFNQDVKALDLEAFIDSSFILYQLSAFQSRLPINETGIGAGKIELDHLKGFELFIPTVAEQQKIAECLSSVDEVIAGQARKVEALKTHKKGLMQQLFPREGETQPRLRFPEFQGAGEWDEKKLEDLAKRGSGHTPSKSHPEYYNGGIKWVSLADSKRLDNGLISETAIEISDKGIENSSAVLHSAGTVFISRDAGIGKSAVMSDPMAVSQHFIAWTCKPRLLSNWFLYHLLQNSKPLFERGATGSTIKTIGLQFFIDLAFRVPALAEQQRIADCLNSLDKLINSETQKLEALKNHKKGLMQQLFPTQDDLE